MIPLRDTIPSRCVPVATWALIAVNTLVFLFQQMLSPFQAERLIFWFGLVPARYTHPGWARWVGLPVNDWWPFLTHMFLHGNWAHLIGNMWTLWIFGDNVEDRMGPVRFMTFYLFCGVIAGFAQYLMSAHSRVPMVGASGAVAGVLGAYFVMYPHSRVITLFPILFYPVFVAVPAVTYLFVWFLSQMLSGMIDASMPVRMGGGIAWWAHIGGFLCGLFTHRFFVIDRVCHRRRPARDELGMEGAWKPWI